MGADDDLGEKLGELDQDVFEEGRDGEEGGLELVGDAHVVVGFYGEVLVFGGAEFGQLGWLD